MELKYGSGAIGGNSGIYKHVQDFSKFKENNFFNPLFSQELVHIINSLDYLGIEIPFKTPYEEDLLRPEFYFIILNNKAELGYTSPKQTIAGYLFEEKRWGCTRLTTKDSIEQDFGDITEFHGKFPYVKNHEFAAPVNSIFRLFSHSYF